MMWMPDRGSSQPLYQQIADDIERRIAYGEFPPGSLLPSERKLAAQLGVEPQHRDSGLRGASRVGNHREPLGKRNPG